MKSPFNEYVIGLHTEGVSNENIHEAAKKHFKGSTICLYQVERVVDNFRKGLITETGEFKDGNH